MFYYFYYFKAFETSCFSGEYVTGERIGDAYFTKLFALRNEEAKQKRNNGENSKELRPQQSNSGCESVSNDTRRQTEPENACEAITNNGAIR
jgi:hypothetical protein